MFKAVCNRVNYFTYLKVMEVMKYEVELTSRKDMYEKTESHYMRKKLEVVVGSHIIYLYIVHFVFLVQFFNTFFSLLKRHSFDKGPGI